MNIRSSTLSLAVIATLALSGCDKLPLPGIKQATGGGGNSLKLDKEARGELTSSSGVNYNDGSRHQIYTLRLEANQAIELQLGGALNGSLAVYKGPLLVASTANTQGMGEDGSQASATSLAFRSTEAGEYTVAVNGAQASAYGPYVLTAKPIVAYDGKPLTPGGNAIDWLISESQDYKFTIANAGLYVITAESANFDTVLKVSGNGVEEENDDGGNGLNSRLQMYLEPGEYTANVRSLADTRGSFKLAIANSTLEAGTVVRDGTELPLNQRVNGLLGSGGSRSFNLVLSQHSRVSFDARSSDFDTVLEVSGNGVNAEDDDGGNGTNSRLDLNLAPGTYTVDVRSLGGNSGSFTLQASAANGNLNRSTAADAIEAAAASAD
ncbi:ABC transporter substrate-binding protein [Stenotrophomonas ginsengisoli]|uniref:ABC transporter substrate-binding protein n=1 Tax=Stenotrophomonas ginsengisoli TaxID=336566 RepID=UPI000ACEF635|nr:ABC transporter substrate-binding protein [Stenotrophomonas ginsengisoli]